ncbi:MAG: ABC transporter ATP-binding protein, partial [Bacillota bacterium]
MFRPIMIRKTLLGNIKQQLRNRKIALAGMAGSKIFLLAVGLSTPWLYKLLIDDVMVGGKLKVLLWVCGGYLGLYVLETLVLAAQRYFGNRLFIGLSFAIKTDLWRNCLRAPFVVVEKFSAGDLKNRIDSDTDAFEKFINQHIIEYGYNIGVILVTGVVMFFISWKMALFGFAMVPLSFWLTKRLGNRLRNSSEIYRHNWGEYENWLQSTLQGWREVKSLNIEKRQQRTFAAYWHTLSKLFIRNQFFWWANRSFIGFKNFFVTRMNLYFIGGLLIFSGEITIGGLLVFMKYYEQLFSGINAVSESDMQLAGDRPAVERVADMLAWPCPAIEKKLRLSESEPVAAEFSNVDYSYDNGDTPALNGISFAVKTGEHLAIVGRSGGGKSTLLKLLLGMYPPSSGEIKFAGQNVNSICEHDLHKQIGVVMQDSLLFNLSIAENLRLVKPDALQSELTVACKKAFIYEFIDELPDKFATIIGERGVKLSGGQRQRLAIARLFLGDARLIIFDEATSALDYDSEKAIHESVRNLAEGKTIITVAHRLSSVIEADRVVVIDNGRVVGE